MTVIFMFDDPPVNVRWYYAGAWRDRYEKLQELVTKYGSDPTWKVRLDVERADVDQIAKLSSITQDERNTVDKILALKAKQQEPTKADKKDLIRFWPNPGKFSKQVSDTSRGVFLNHLDDWFYGDLSQASHLSFTGLERRGGAYARPARGFDLERHHDDSRSAFMGDFLAIYSALLSEVSCQLGLDYEKKRLREAVWPAINGLDPAELYKKRYEDWLR